MDNSNNQKNNMDDKVDLTANGAAAASASRKRSFNQISQRNNPDADRLFE